MFWHVCRAGLFCHRFASGCSTKGEDRLKEAAEVEDM
jgi:hypothetical protein